MTPTLRAAIPDVRLTGQLFDLLLSGYFNPKLNLYCAMEDLSTGHQWMLYAFNKYQKDFIPTSLYLRWQVTFQTLFITVKVMQVRDPTVSLYICQLGSQTADHHHYLLGYWKIPSSGTRVFELHDEQTPMID